jgi:two-component system response regulator (stage 0 sporulation protein A)
MGYKTTIVYAEDNRDISILMDDYFKIDNRTDFEIIGFAYDGCEALDMISSMNPDIVLLDMKMPNLNGWEVLERINEMAPEKRPVIIALSAVDDNGFVRKVLESGAAAYIKKPFEMKRLLDELQNAREALTQ